ncbi:ADOP family duplicated permease [Paludibaculum fermentans]|uniref:ABC transporter permease n=1 Tax=Paludibaculum fermentans TaxID=1473598 RepID=UPI003EBEA1FD
MRALRAFLLRLAGTLGQSRREREFQQELEAHLQFHIDDNLRAGMTEDEARREAVLQLGGVEPVKESMRDRWTLAWLETWWQDLRYSLRSLRRNPGYATTAALSIALGIGASVSIFTVADSVLLRPLPYKDPAGLMMIWEANPKIPNANRNVVSPGNYLDWKARSRSFDQMAVVRDLNSVLSDGHRVEELKKQAMTANLLPMLGVQPHRGRFFTEAEDRPGQDAVILISHRIWQTWFDGDEAVLGRKVTVNSTPRTIIGVMPPGFYFRNRETDVWEPLGMDLARDYRQTSGRYILVAGRLKSGVTRDQAQAEMAAIATQLEAAHPSFNKNWTINVESLRDSLVSKTRTSLLVLLGAVGLLLLVACANVANLMLARCSTRQREMAVRASMGAGRWRVIRQLLTESVLLSFLGGAAGVILARWMVIGLLALAPKMLTSAADIRMDARVLLFSVALSTLTGILFGFAPAWTATRFQLFEALRQGAGTVSRRGALRAWLVAAEVALSVILLTGAGLLFQSLAGLQSVPSGLNPDNLLTFRVSLPAARYQPPYRRTVFFTQLLDRLRQAPGVQSASAVSYLPFDGMAAATNTNIQGRPVPRAGEELLSMVRTVMPGYFQTMGIPMKQGRDFTAADNEEKSPMRFIVNEAYVQKFLQGSDPLSTSINALMGDTNPYGQIIGVVGDVKEGSLDKPAQPTIYYPHALLIYGGMTVLLKTSTDPRTLIEPARRIVRELDPAQPIAEARTMDEVLGETLARQRFSALLLVGFSILSLLLAAVGVYGVLAYSVTERTREIGLRLALGAGPGKITAQVVAAGARFVLAGTLAGVAGSLALAGLLQGLLFGVEPRDPATFAAVPAVLLAVALLAAYLPARRAGRLDPMSALRMD